MISMMLFYVFAGYFGTPSKYQPVGDGDYRPDPNSPDVKWPWWWPRPPKWGELVIGAIGGLAGGYVVNYVFPNDVTLSVLGAVFAGRALYDVVNVVRSSTVKTL